MRVFPWWRWIAGVLVLAGCSAMASDYIPVSSISKDGFARDRAAVERLAGQEVKLWGYVDHGNLYGDEGAKLILGEWWSGEGPDADTWRFNLKAAAGDAVGRSFEVYAPDDAGRDALLAEFAADARAQRPTQVFVTGKLSTFAAPANTVSLTGLALKVASSQDVLLELPHGAN